MDIEVHRARRTFYTHTAVLLNVPGSELDTFFNLQDWPIIASAKFLGLHELEGKSLSDFSPAGAKLAVPAPALSVDDLNSLLNAPANGQTKSADEVVAELRALRDRRVQESQAISPSTILQNLEQRTGVQRPTWESAGQELLEALMPAMANDSFDLFSSESSTPRSESLAAAQDIGLAQMRLVTDFPIVTATYAYSRADSRPGQCFLRPFPPSREHGGKEPIYVDKVQADALVLALSRERVAAWLEANGYPAVLPGGTDVMLSAQAYYVSLFDDLPLTETLGMDRPHARLVFGLLHTLTHLAIRAAALLSGLESTSLSEYVLPRALSTAIFCNHRSGATIGALTALFEQSLAEWLHSVREARRCVYDPDCREREGSCHNCTHLAETSCRFFNLNLSRAFLFGGNDRELGELRVGYFDPSLP